MQIALFIVQILIIHTNSIFENTSPLLQQKRV